MRLSKLFKMYRRSRFGKQGGFSLVELMVVVAIIGILAAIAIPNYQRFQRRARQSEVKLLAAGIYNAEKMFISEHGFGSTNLHQTGFTPDGTINYMVGFSAVEGGSTVINKTGGRPAGFHGPLPSKAGGDLTTFHVCGGGITTTALASNSSACTVAIGADKDTSGKALTNFPTGIADFQTCKNTGSGGCGPPPTCTGMGSGAACSVVSAAVMTNTGRNNVSFSIGGIAGIGGSKDDIWVMTQDKTLRNAQDGTQ